jgi:hypothetical protein
VVGLWAPDGWKSHGDAYRMATLLESPSIGASIRSVLLDSYSIALTQRMIEKWRRPPPPSTTNQPPAERQRVHAKIVASYEANLRIIRALGREYDFPVAFFWQPDIYYGTKPHDWFENGVLAWEPDTAGEYAAVYREAEQRASEGEYVFLGHLFDDVRQPLYIDNMHISPEGNRIVARKIAETIRAQGRPRPNAR